MNTDEKEVSSEQLCCLNCKWFEKRTGFCRKNPPTPIPMFVKNVGNITTSVFPKISMPNLDWCGEFDKLEKLI